MSNRVSHSVLDPFVGPPIKRLYPFLRIPRRLPPEAIIGIGHLFAIVAATGFANCVATWWGGLLVAIGVLGNHIADCLDGTHARTTGQCRNGGELLDHFVDPLSFSYWMVGWGIAVSSWPMAVAAVIIIYATSVMTNIKSKIIGEFTLSRFGPTEFKFILILIGVVFCAQVASASFSVESLET